MNNANLQRYGGHEMEVAAALAAQAGAPPRYAAMRPGGQPQDPSAAGQSALDSVQALAQGRADYFHYLQPRHPQHPHQQMQQEHKDMQDHHHSEQQQGVGQPPSTFMGLPDRPPINVAPDTGPLRIPPPGMTMPSMSKMQLSDIPTSFIHPHDVLCGRGGGTNNHNGNEKFRELVTQQKVLYLHSSKRDKPFVSRGIVRAVRAQNPPGRFLQKDEKTGFWYDIGDQKAREKTSQALREGAPEIRREITSTMAPASALRPQIIPPAGLPPSPLAPAIPMSSQLRQMQLQRQDDANLANMRAAAAMGYPGAHQAHMAAMVAAGRGAPGQANTGAMGQQVSSTCGECVVAIACHPFSPTSFYHAVAAPSHDGIWPRTNGSSTGTFAITISTATSTLTADVTATVTCSRDTSTYDISTGPCSRRRCRQSHLPPECRPTTIPTEPSHQLFDWHIHTTNAATKPGLQKPTQVIGCHENQETN